MTIDTIIFDLDNTLLSSDHADQLVFDRIISFLVDKMPDIDGKVFEASIRKQAVTCFDSYNFYDFTVQIGISPIEGLWGDFKDASFRFPEMASQINNYRQDVWTRALQDVGISDIRLARLLALMFVAMRRETSLVYEDTYTVLDDLYERYQLILLTNGAPALQDYKLRKAPKLKKYFKKVIISGNFGQGKPAPDLFEFVLSRAQATRETTVMVGDSLFTDILGANTVGIRSIWVDRGEAAVVDMIQPDFTVTNLTDVLAIIKKEDDK